MKLNFLENIISQYLQSLGKLAARHPLYFIIVPLLLSAVLSAGFINLIYNVDANYLVTPSNGVSEQSKNVLHKLFPTNTSKDANLARITIENVYIVIVITNKREGESVLNEKLFEDILKIDSIVRNTVIVHNGEEFKYEDLCGKDRGRCFTNTVVGKSTSRDIFSKIRRVKYPLELDESTFTFEEYVSNFGGVTLDENGYMSDAKAIRLLYAKDISNVEKKIPIQKWEIAVLDQLHKQSFDSANFHTYTFQDLLNGWKNISNETLRLSFVIAAIITVFSMCSLMIDDWIASKPWLGLSGCISAALSITSAYGSMGVCGIETTYFNTILPFLILGTEIDNTFMLVAAWRRSKRSDNVESRMGETYKDAAVSITITSLTNFLSFCIGVTAPFPVVKLFCAYAATSIFYSYLYQITFFGGCMALDGYREERRLHALLFRVIDTDMKNKKTVENTNTNQDIISKLFQEKFGTFLSFIPVKIFVALLFFLCLAMGIFGMMHVEEGSEIINLLPPDENTLQYTKVTYKYFTLYPYSLNIVVNKSLNYADPKVQKSIEDMLDRFEAHPNIEESIKYSWLYYYKKFLSLPISSLFTYGYETSNKDDFIMVLRNVFLRLHAAKTFENDIIFNENNTEIQASRFILFCKDIGNKHAEKKFLYDMRKLVEESELPITVHSLLFPFIEQGIIIRDVLLQLAWVTTLTILLIFCAFVPNLKSALFISMVVVSVLIETVGFMAFWGINLDMFSLVVLLMSIGFSINYPTHISFFFSTAKDVTPNEKLKYSVGHVGFPIFQGSLSTILGVIALTSKSTYIYAAFFKIVVLISVGTAIHAMFILPVFLSLIETVTFANIESLFRKRVV